MIVVDVFSDPSCKMKVHGIELLMPLSHGLPLYQRVHKKYDTLPKRLAEYVASRYGEVVCIDVGANIGDTIAAFMLDDHCRFLGVEPNPRFKSYLDQNWGVSKNVTAISALCAAKENDGRFIIAEHHGTARVISSDIGVSIPQKTLDQIVGENPQFKDVNILKVDTDGYDLGVLLGGEATIDRKKPVVLFECDAFDNPNYINEFFEVMALFQRCGYESLHLYDNFGNYMGSFNPRDNGFRMTMRNIIAWQMATKIVYFDILFLHPLDFESFIP